MLTQKQHWAWTEISSLETTFPFPLSAHDWTKFAEMSMMARVLALSAAWIHSSTQSRI